MSLDTYSSRDKRCRSCFDEGVVDTGGFGPAVYCSCWAGREQARADAADDARHYAETHSVDVDVWGGGVA